MTQIPRYPDLVIFVDRRTELIALLSVHACARGKYGITLREISMINYVA